MPLASRTEQAVADYYIANHRNDPLYLPIVTYHLLQAKVRKHYHHRLLASIKGADANDSRRFSHRVYNTYSARGLSRECD